MVNEGEKKDVEIKTKSPMWLVILIAILVIALGCEFAYCINNRKQNQDNNIVSEQEKNNIINYISKIYPVPKMETTGEFGFFFPIFNTIGNANKEWIWSTAYINSINTTKEELESSAIKLFGNSIGKWNDDESYYENLGFVKNGNNEYEWVGQNGDSRGAEYIIKSINKIENNKFQIEIVEGIVDAFTEEKVIEVRDINGNELGKIATNEITADNKKVIDYLNENKDNLPAKILTIEYNTNNHLYHIISSQIK